MYRQGHRARSHYKRYIGIGLVVILLVVGGVVAARHYFKANTTITNAPAVDSVVTAPEDETRTFTEPTFSIALPKDWIAIHNVTTSPQPTYAWENTAGNKGVETLYAYVDNIPSTMAVNAEVPVMANDNKLVVTGNVSSNCTTFTGQSGGSSTASGSVPAKWDGVNFLCDVANYERDVVGTSSASAINSVTVPGPNSGAHRYFFVYTDDSAEPNYSIFTNALNSFTAL